MLTRLITDRRAWTRATLDPPGNWYFTLPGAVLDMLDREIAVWRRRPVPTTAWNSRHASSSRTTARSPKSLGLIVPTSSRCHFTVSRVRMTLPPAS